MAIRESMNLRWKFISNAFEQEAESRHINQPMNGLRRNDDTMKILAGIKIFFP